MVPIAAPNVDRWWPQALAVLSPTIAMGAEQTPDSVHRDLIEGRAVLWRNRYAFAVTSWRDMPAGRTAYVMAGGERPALWIRAARHAWMRWARSLGCTQIRMAGRRGWQRLLPDAEHAVMLRYLL